ncbi:hypothetical protein CYCD_30580 [Tenuifilaceae bacterium CYCD]|nr:hypothetical protein CYCD_30580 [Tenuifilaceae bacterium CYCD]
MLKAKNTIVGNWVMENNPQYRLQFNKNGTFKEFINDSTEIFDSSRSNKYYILCENDTLWLYLKRYNCIINDKKKRTYIEKRMIKFENNQITMITYKMRKGVTNHIDEYAIWKRQETEISKSTHPKLSYMHIR